AQLPERDFGLLDAGLDLATIFKEPLALAREAAALGRDLCLHPLNSRLNLCDPGLLLLVDATEFCEALALLADFFFQGLQFTCLCAVPTLLCESQTIDPQIGVEAIHEVQPQKGLDRLREDGLIGCVFSELLDPLAIKEEELDDAGRDEIADKILPVLGGQLV